MEVKKAKGLRSIVVFIPTIITIAILYILIIVCTILINIDTTNMLATNKEITDCIDTINNIQSRANKLSSTAISFAHLPVIPTPTKPLNEQALGPYIEEYNIEEKKPENVLKTLENYNLDDETLNLINSAIDEAEAMVITQAHAIRLINTVSYIDISEEKYLKYIPEFNLLDQELTMTDEEKLDAALEMLLNRDYSIHQQTLPDYIKEVTNKITYSTLQKNNEISDRIKLMRGFLWGSILLILLSNLLLFIVLLKKLVFPITKFAKRIDNNERLETEHALYEANYLAKSYNALLDRHKEFETELRSVAEIDSLTQLPNRYCYNEFLKKTPEENKSACVFLFDINNLKYTNDTYGHDKGDELIRNASSCIKDCFLIEEKKNCYRIGGDEFVAIIENISEDEIDDYIQSFNKKQKELNVSIAIGYAYANNIAEYGYEKLIIRADKNMYKNKKEYKNQGDNSSAFC